MTITFDGGYAASVQHALPMLAAHELPSTWFLVSDAIGGTLETREVAPAEVWRSSDPALVEIGNHSATHPLVRRSGAEIVRRIATDPASVPRSIGRALCGRATLEDQPPSPIATPVSRDAAIDDFRAGKERLEVMLDRPVPAFAYPSGRASSRMQSAVSDLGHTSARTSRPGWNVPGKVAPLALAAQTWMHDTDLATARRWVEHAVDTGAWLIEVFHLVDRESSYPWAVTPETLRSHLDDLAGLGVWVETQTRVLEHLDAETGSVV